MLYQDSEIFGNGALYPYNPFETHSWVENCRLAAIAETMSVVPTNSTEEWIKRNRLLALNGLETDSPNLDSNSGCLSPSVSNPSELSPAASCAQFESCISSEQSVAHRKPESGNRTRLALKNSKENSKIHSGCTSTDQSVSKNTNKATTPLPKELNAKLRTNPRSCCEPMLENKENIAKLPSYDATSLMNFKSSSGFFDSHCHIDLMFEYEGFKGTYANYMKQHQDSYPDSYNGCIAVFCKPWTFEKDHLWRKHLDQDNVWGAFGCHPKQARSYNWKVERSLEFALAHSKVRALGEIGLDYSKNNGQYKQTQKEVFKRQLEIAKRRNLRVVIHCREADDDTISILQKVLPKDAIFHLHCFTGTWSLAERWIDEFPNVYIGITNLVTFPSAAATHDVARRLPLSRLLLETDSPYFKPSKSLKRTPHAHPGMAIHVAAQIAALKKVPLDKVLQATCANTRRMYNLP